MGVSKFIRSIITRGLLQQTLGLQYAEKFLFLSVSLNKYCFCDHIDWAIRSILNSWPIKIVLLVRQIYFLKTLIRPLGTIFMGLYSMIRVSKINFGLKQFISALLNFGGRKRPFDSWDQILSLVKWNFQNTLFRWK